MPIVVTFVLFGGSLLASLCNHTNFGLGLALAAYLWASYGPREDANQ
jgi:hypothetical protein